MMFREERDHAALFRPPGLPVPTKMDQPARYLRGAGFASPLVQDDIPKSRN